MSEPRSHTADGTSPVPAHQGGPVHPDNGADDALLVAAARANRQAFRPLYERYVQAVYRYCYVRLGSREAAEDATSEIFIKTLTGLGGYRGGLFVAWLFRIAQSVVIDIQRKDRRSQPSLPLEAAHQLSNTTDGAVDAESAIMLRSALDAIPSDLRTIIELQLAGWSSEQIGAALGRSPSAIRMARARALDQIRTHLTSSGNSTQRGGLPC